MGSVVLMGDWKLYKSLGVKGDALFNLKNDPMETKNELMENTQQAELMTEKLNVWLKNVNAKYPKYSEEKKERAK